MADAPEVAWAAGLFEGEGTAFVSGGGQRLAIEMTDYDVLLRFQRTVGCGSLAARAPRPSAQAHHKQVWVWQVAHKMDVILVGELLLPYLGRRRTEAVERVLEAARARRTLRRRRGTRDEDVCGDDGAGADLGGGGGA